MKTIFKKYRLSILAAGLGAAALVLRTAMYLLAADHKGLLIPAHPLNMLVWAITAAAAVLIAAAVFRLDGSELYEHNFAPSAAAAIGCFALAGGIGVSVIMSLGGFARLDMIRNLFGVLAIPALIRVGLNRWKGKQSFFLLHAVVCLYLILYAVSHYQNWSSLPQLQDYFFAVIASCLLSLSAYQQTAFDVGLGKRRMQLGTGLLGAFFCIASLAGGSDPLLYLGGAVWCLTGLCHLTPVPKPEPKEDENAAS